MKFYFNKSKCLLGIIAGISFALASCKQNIVKPAQFPDQHIYMPTSYNGNYLINSVAVPGQTFRYTVDLTNKTLNIPLGAYRSGINNDGAFTVDIVAKMDTVNTLITSGSLKGVTLLPATNFTLPTQVAMNDGAEAASFNLGIDLNFLLSNVPKVFAIGIGISSSSRTLTSPTTRGTTIVIIDTRFLIPAATFSFTTDPTIAKKINFSNASAFAVSYVWDFGDGTPTVTDTTPTHTYGASGSYVVTLTATGAAGSQNSSVLTKTVTIP